MADEKIDIKIPGYQIQRPLGRGGMATVYLAVQESMEREVALKVMLPQLTAADPSFSERFVREAKIIAKLSHPNINAVYDVGVAGQYHFFSMEYITGGDLKSRIRRGMAPKAALAIVRQIASALAFAHSKGYVHRDVKPENVMFRENGTAVLTDFGIAKTNDATNMTATGTVIGTPHYMSPEQAMGRNIDRRSDIYSLGVMLYEMLTGNVPYTGDSAVSIGIKHLTGAIPDFSPDLKRYQPLLNRFLAKSPEQRFQSGEEILAAIDAIDSGATISQPAAADFQRTIVMDPIAATVKTEVLAKPSRRRPALMIGIAAVIIAIAAAAIVVVRRPDATPPVAVAPASTEASSTNATQIAQLLSDAESAAHTGSVFGADGAVAKYRQVLALDATNADATRALNQIAGQLITQAERAIEANNLDQAESFLKQAEEADSAHPMLFSRRLALSELRKKPTVSAAAAPTRDDRKPTVATRPTATPAATPTSIDTRNTTVASVDDTRARETRERTQKLQGALTRFQELVATETLTAARAKLAEDLVGEATRLAPDDARVRGLPNRLADAYLTLATATAADKKFADAEALIQRGLEFSPSHRDLLALQKEVAAKKAPRQRTFGSF